MKKNCKKNSNLKKHVDKYWILKKSRQNFEWKVRESFSILNCEDNIRFFEFGKKQEIKSNL